MIDTNAIRSKILLLALQGKLTEQLAEDGNAQELYDDIQKDKCVLLQQGKIKKEKPLPPITEKELPFEIPENWKWIRWGELSESIQYGYNAPAKSEGKIKMVRISDIQDGKVMWNEVPYCDIADSEIDQYILKKNDILFARTGGTVGKSYIVSEISEKAVFAGYLIRTSYSVKLCAQYMKYFMESSLYWRQLQNGTIATAQPNCNGKTLSKMIVPLPPYAEQIRIVDMFDSINSLLGTIDEFQNAYEIDKSILKDKLIDAGIRGKLAKQFSEDGTAEDLYVEILKEKEELLRAGKIKKEKKLSEITEKEIPFLIPANWKWVRWGELSQAIQYGYNAPARQEGRIKMVRISDIQEGKVKWETVPYCDIDENNIESYLLHENDILFARTGGTVGKSYIVTDIPENSVFAGYLIRTIYSSKLCAKYMKYFMESQLYWRQLRNGTIATAQPNCNGQTLSKMILPLPPLKEQQRIVDKIDEILSIIEC